MDFKVLFSQLATVYAKLSKQQKIIIATAIVGIVAFLIFLILYSSKKSGDGEYKTLFNSLSAEDASKVVAQLDKENIPYKIEDNNIIKVPRNLVYKERISIASLGIPKSGGTGYELFDKQEFGATNFDQKIKHLRALEGELSRTINSLSPIKSSSVNLALPKESLFVEKKVLPTASVMIVLDEGRRLSYKQIRGIKNLVASAVAGLTPANVMLVDSDGETLGEDDEMSQLGELSVVQQKYKVKEEKKRQQKIIDVIAPFVGGKNKVVAQVTIDYDFSIKNSTVEKYDPENVVRSEQTSEEKREGTKPAAVGGVPGTVSNIGPVKGLKNKESKEKYSKNTGTTNYEVGKTVSTTKSQFARIKRITAAVIVDGKYKEKLDKDSKPTGDMEYEPLSKSELDALTSLVSRSIGIDKSRGDQISVENLQFKRDIKGAKKDNISQVLLFSQKYLTPFSGLFKYLFVLILLLVVYKKFITPFAEKMLEVSKEDDELEKPDFDLEDEEGEDLVGKAQAMRKKVEEQLGIKDNFDEDILKYEVILEKVKTMTEDDPQDVAALLQALLSEESELVAPKENKG